MPFIQPQFVCTGAKGSRVPTWERAIPSSNWCVRVRVRACVCVCLCESGGLITTVACQPTQKHAKEKAKTSTGKGHTYNWPNGGEVHTQHFPRHHHRCPTWRADPLAGHGTQVQLPAAESGALPTISYLRVGDSSSRPNAHWTSPPAQNIELADDQAFGDDLMGEYQDTRRYLFCWVV